MRVLKALLVTAGLLLGVGNAQAGYQFVFADTSGTIQTNFNLDFNVQTFVDVRVYLQATGTTDINTLRNDGLKSYGVRLNYSGAQAQVLNDAAVTSNAGFTAAEFKDVTTTFAAVNDQINNTSPTVKAGATEDRIYLATFRFTGLSNGTQANITVDPDPTLGSDDTVTGGNVALDGLITNSSATITVTNVPEPGTWALMGLVAAGIGGTAVRRRRLAAA